MPTSHEAHDPEPDYRDHEAHEHGLLRHRSGAGEPLLLLHGVGESAAGWYPVTEALSREYDVLVFDLPGFGASAPLPPGVTPSAAALADAVERQLDELDLGTVHIAGYSLGARVSLELATRGRTRSVVAIAPDGLGTPQERLFETLALLGRRSYATALAPSAQQLTATGAGRTAFFASERVRPWQLTPVDARQLLLSFANSPAYVPTVMAGMYDTVRRLDRITCPVLLVQGTTDPLVSSQSPRFLAFVPHARIRWLPGLSHIPISDDPTLIAGLILEFIGAERAVAA